MNTIHLRLKAQPEIDSDYLTVKVSIDGVPVFDEYPVDVVELVRSANQDGEFLILTCGCGVAECAAIKRGIEVHHAHNNVFWHVLAPRPERRFVFARMAYDQAIQRLLKQGQKTLAYRRDVGLRPFKVAPRRNARFFEIDHE